MATSSQAYGGLSQDFIRSLSIWDSPELQFFLVVVLIIAVVAGNSEGKGKSVETVKQPFIPKKAISIKDSVVFDMLNSNDHKKVCFVVTDPHMADNPIVYASDGFCNYTGYPKHEIEGRNCCFLQGPDTDPKDVATIRKAVNEHSETSVCLLNYKKDGSTFFNQFFLCPIWGTGGDKKVEYYLGVQTEVKAMGKGQDFKNPGWVYAMGLKEGQ